MPPTWRGADPDRRPVAERPKAGDRAWDEPLRYPVPTQSNEPGFDVLGSVPLPGLEPTPPTRVRKDRVKKAEGETTTAKKKKGRTVSSNHRVTDFFTNSTAASQSASSTTAESMNGISSKLASLGGMQVPKKDENEKYTERDIDHALYLWPEYLLPDLKSKSSLTGVGLELVGLEHDNRDIVLDLKHCFLEIEPLLHSSPQIFTAEDWEGVSHVPADKRGFKVVIALEMETHTLAWVSKDANCRVYWFSRADIEFVRPHRVPREYHLHMLII
ncbi:hypothetical protein R3P38DRAFT_3244224 [Favolaschia claudopus]|uniref:Uncharacterized protein n=1 Tax=Favolaschia claudopus TaxID=2862362 RepID=A0AAV9Z236_9AGAR